VGCLGRLIPAHGPAPAAAAWRLGLIHHLRGDPVKALDLYRRGHDDPAGTESDRALAAAWGASAAWLTGDIVACRELADAAGALARRTGDDRALAAAHTAWAMLAALEGDRRSNDTHYLRALDHAQRCGDLVQVIRIRANRGSRYLEEGYFADALSELGPAVALADLTGFAVLHTLAVLNRAEALRHLGRLDEASQDYLTGLAEAQRLGTAMAGYALVGLAAVHADQGYVSLAQAGFEEAIRLAEPAGDVQGLVPALAGLARVVMVDNPDAAAGHAARAVALPASLAHTNALLASGWVAAARGRSTELTAFADAAHAAARERRDRAGIAEALELRAIATDQADVRVRLLTEAEALWTTLACPLPLARTRLALARAGGDVDVGEVESTCRRLGARTLAAEAAAMRRHPAAGLTIRTLGGFRVLRDGAPVPLPEWRSRKARDLLKILVARRGVPVARDAVVELLWPQADRARASARLSVALSTLRAVLDPTKHKTHDAYVASAGGALWLRREAIEIDVEEFLTAATTGPLDQVSTERLSLVEAIYTGDFCAEDPYADWALALRGEALAAYVTVAGALAQRHAAEGDHDTAIRYLLRLQAHEPFDERTSLLLVLEFDAAGRHADARRTYQDYVARMAEWDLPAAPYPAHGQRPTSTTNDETVDQGPVVPPSVARTRQ
jgi:DNA-binding SARP family transcriptional activator